MIERNLAALAHALGKTAQNAPRRLRRKLTARARLYERMARASPAQAILLYAALNGLEGRLPGFLAAHGGDSGGALAQPAQGQVCTLNGITYIDITGELLPPLWAACQDAVSNAARLAVTFNSCGGVAPVGLQLFLALRDKPDTIGTIHKLCASAALFALQGCRIRLMESDSWILVHAPQHGVFGPLPDFLAALEQLKKCQWAGIECMQRCRRPADGGDWFDGKDRWLRANEALRAGLIDEIVPAVPDPAPVLAGFTPERDDPDYDAENLLIELLHRLRSEFKDAAAFKDVLSAFLQLGDTR